MRIGVQLPMSLSDGPGRMPSWTDILTFARHAEAAGLDSVWVCDHMISSPPEGPVEGIHEGWTIVSALAATTSRIEIGQLVTCVSFRNPALLAKMAVTADAISGGRLILGLGAGWDETEHAAFGFPSASRVERTEEALEVIGPLLRGESVSFAGRHYHLRDARLLPAPDRQVPILVAANRPRMLSLTARHADAWNTAWYGAPDERLHSRLADLGAALTTEGRDPETLRRTVGMRVRITNAKPADNHDEDEYSASAAELAQTIASYEGLGIDDLIVGLAPTSFASLERLAETVDLVRRSRR
jgi:alkanesulfonate monooxygenase SsuD/methylene tetrahydromethanopterin reductase-like flavin-dependent oxidoreductase (luciferase family)